MTSLSQILAFFTGDVDALIRGYRTGGLRAIRAAATSPVMAGFYNISLVDLDILTGVAVHLLGEAPIDFVNSLVEVSNGGPGGDCYVVSPGWVKLIAAHPGRVRRSARKALDRGPSPGASWHALDEEELGRGLRDLIEVCRNAVSHRGVSYGFGRRPCDGGWLALSAVLWAWEVSVLLPGVRAPVARLEFLVFLLEEVQVIPLRHRRLEDLARQGPLPLLHRPVRQADDPLPFP